MSGNGQRGPAQRILDAAFARFQHAGLHAVTIRGVATDLGVTPMSLYRHFRDKDALIEALVQRGLRHLEDGYLARVRRRNVPGWRTVARGYVDFALAEPRLYELLFMSHRPSDDAFARDYHESPGAAFVRWRDAVRETSQATSDAAATEDALHTWAVLHGYCSLYLAGRFGIGEAPFRRLLFRRLGDVIDTLVTRRGADVAP